MQKTSRLLVVIGSFMWLAGCRSAPPLDRNAVIAAARARALPPAKAEPDSPPRTAAALTNMTLTACIEHAMRNNRALARTRSALERAVLGERIASSELFAPELETTLTGGSDSDTDSASAALQSDIPLGLAVSPFLNVDRDDTDTHSYTTAYGVTLSRPLFALHERVRQCLPLSRARRDLFKAENNLQLQQRDLRLQVTRAFYDAQRAAARLGVRQRRVADSAEFLDVVRRRVENGFSPPVDIVNATIDLKRAESAVAAESANVQNSLDLLKQVLGLELDDAITVAQLKGDPDTRFERDFDGDLYRMLARHEKVLNTLADIQVAEHAILVQRDAVHPQVDLKLTLSRTSVGDAFFDDAESGEDEASWMVTYSTELDLGRAKRARLQRLEKEQRERFLELKDTEIQLTRDLRAAFRSLDQFKSQIALDEARFTAEQSRLQATIDRYEQGNVDNLEVTRAKQDVDNAALALLDSRIGLFLAVARVQALLPE